MNMNDRTFPFAAYTDYPFEELGDVPWQKAPMRNCLVLGYDGDKYCRVLVERVELEIKRGYIYEGTPTVAQLTKPPVREYPKEAELQLRLHGVIDEYAGEISFVSVVGTLALVQQEIIMRHTNLEEDE